MITFEDVGRILDEIASDVPEEILKNLNGGINLSAGMKLHPQSKNNDLYVLGEYRNDGFMGRYVVIYYQSFVRAFGHLPEEAQKAELKKILHHELVHHLESLAGERDLEIKDKKFMDKYLNGG